MPYGLPAAGTPLTRTNFAEPLTSVANGAESAASTAQSRADAAHALASGKFSMPAAGLPLSAIDPAAKPITVRRYVVDAWQPRGTASTDVTVLWIKTDTAHPNPPINATHFLLNTDVLLAVTA